MSIEFRKELLNIVDKTINSDRNTQYGEPEDSFKQIAHLWNAYLEAKYSGHKIDHEVTCLLDKEDIGLMMCLFKICRDMNGVKLDNYIDAIGYLACVAPEPNTK